MAWSYSEQLLYDFMLGNKIKELEFYGYRVQADLPEKGYQAPAPIDGQEPDILATYKRETVIVAVQTPSQIEDSDAMKKRFLAFSNLPDSMFHVVVPKGELARVQKAAKKWNVEVDKWIEV